MKVARIELQVQAPRPNPRPIRDALQSLPGAGSVKVLVTRMTAWSGPGTPSSGACQAGRKRLLR